MQPGQPTAPRWAPRAAAAQQLIDGASILADPLALPSSAPPTKASLRSAREHPPVRRIRWFRRRSLAHCRRRLTVAVGHAPAAGRGARRARYVAYRTPLASLRIFEVRSSIDPGLELGSAERSHRSRSGALHFVAVDFGARPWRMCFLAGFDSAQRSFFIWLGFVPYLTSDRVSTRPISPASGGADVCSTMPTPAGSGRSAPGRHQALAAHVAASGNLQSYFDTPRLCTELDRAWFWPRR